MIRYDLACSAGHEFESWFRDSAAFDQQIAAGFVTCPVCGTVDVSKRVMAPAIARGGKARTEPAAVAPSVAVEPGAGPVALVSEKERELRAMLGEVRRFIEQNSEDVGRRFPDEARRMHSGEIEHRAIRGEADASEVKSLLDDGIEVMPLPSLPDERN